MLTLYTTPVIYLFFDGLAQRLAAWRRRRQGPDAPDAPGVDAPGVDAPGEPAPQS